MQTSIEKLYGISKKVTRRIIGLMSGTSLDGLDIALCDCTGHGKATTISVLHFATIPYPANFRNMIADVFSKKQVNMHSLVLLHKQLTVTHARMVLDCLDQWKINAANVDIIASHGQTIYHAPVSLHGDETAGNATFQVGDGDHLACETGIITISDFRQKNIAAGGEGAPLVAYGDYLLYANDKKDRVLLNIGGISNFTFLPAASRFSDISCSDIGPGNTLLDAWTRLRYPGCSYDKDAIIAQQGRINEDLLATLMSDDYFSTPLPRTTGPEYFNLNWLDKKMSDNGFSGLPPEDVLRTLNELTVCSIAGVINTHVRNEHETTLIVTGGGTHNPLLVQGLKNKITNIVFEDSLAVSGIHPDAKEAVLFALLANETIAGNKLTFENGPANLPAVSMGKISFPD